MSVKLMSVATRKTVTLPDVASVSMTVTPVGIAGMAMMPVSVSALSTSDAWGVQSDSEAKNCHQQDNAGRTCHGFLRRVSGVIAAAKSNDFLIPGKADLQAFLKDVWRDTGPLVIAINCANLRLASCSIVIGETGILPLSALFPRRLSPIKKSLKRPEGRRRD